MNRLPAPGLPEPALSAWPDRSELGEMALAALDIEFTRALGAGACVSTEGMCLATAAFAACSWWIFFLFTPKMRQSWPIFPFKHFFFLSCILDGNNEGKDGRRVRVASWAEKVAFPMGKSHTRPPLVRLAAKEQAKTIGRPLGRGQHKRTRECARRGPEKLSAVKEINRASQVS